MGTRGIKGNGSITQLPSGKWRVRVTAARGSGKRIGSVHETRAAAEKELRTLLNEKDNSGLAINSKITVADAVEEWIDAVHDDLTVSTREGYLQKLNAYIRYSPLNVIPLSRVTEADLRAFFRSMQDGSLNTQKAALIQKKIDAVKITDKDRVHKLRSLKSQLPKAALIGESLSNSIQRQTFSILSKTFQHELSKELKAISRNPMLHIKRPDAMTNPQRDYRLGIVKKEQASTTTPLTHSQLQQLWLEAEKDKDRLYARWRLALDVGLRPSEALGLEWQDLELPMEGSGLLRVRQQLQHSHAAGEAIIVSATKTRSGEREIILAPYLVRILRHHKRTQGRERRKASSSYQPWYWGTGRARRHIDLVFTQANGEPVRHRLDDTRWHKLLSDAGLPSMRRYVARHTAASTAIYTGQDIATVSKNLGHSSPQVTLGIYTHSISEGQVRAAESQQKHHEQFEESMVPLRHPEMFDEHGDYTGEVIYN